MASTINNNTFRIFFIVIHLMIVAKGQQQYNMHRGRHHATSSRTGNNPNYDNGKDPTYYGRRIGDLVEFAHGIRGTAYAVDETTLYVRGFAYDGTGPDAYFWVGNSPRPSPDGYIIPYPEEYVGREPPVLRAYNNTDIILRLPMGKRIRDIRWLSVWCRRFTVDFGEVFIPPDLDVPKPRVLPEFKRLAHSLRSGNLSVLDARTFYIPDLHYDGAGPDAYFWAGRGPEPDENGIKVPNELGSLEPLRGYQGEDIEIQLPGNLTVYDIDWLAMWCVQYRHNFGHVMIPGDLDVPPALGQTKITPPWWYNPTSTTTKPITNTNCREFLNRRMQVRWEIQGDYVQIEVSARMGEQEWAAFGLSGQQGKAQMKGADVTVIHYISAEERFYATDYYLTDKAQCDGRRGACPDERLGGGNDAKIVRGSRRNGVTSVTYRRPLQTNEPINDLPIPSGNAGNTERSVIAAIGPLNSRREVNSHNSRDRTGEDEILDFAATDDHQCTASLYELSEASIYTPWKPQVIYALGSSDPSVNNYDTYNTNNEDLDVPNTLDATKRNTFSARIGPTGGKRGYTPITGHPSWGIAWYINDLLIPELYFERGQTYTFVVEGGNDITNPARYHPFYICDSSEGGYGQKSEQQRMEQKVYAGVEYDMDGYPYPTAAGRYCEWVHKTIDRSSEFETFEAFKETLTLECVGGESAILNWTVPMDAPDLLYYQCYSHNNLGWKINIVNPGTKLPRKNANGTNRANKIMHNVSWPLAAFAFVITSLLRGISCAQD